MLHFFDALELIALSLNFPYLQETDGWETQNFFRRNF